MINIFAELGSLISTGVTYRITQCYNMCIKIDVSLVCEQFVADSNNVKANPNSALT
tara:strand:+ start:55 stop:222 length:168 start_codon:yes stop_codon:yes gene_type:complete